MSEITLYHLIAQPMDSSQAAACRLDAESIVSKRVPLGNQSGGAFFFTTQNGIENHSKEMQGQFGLNKASEKNLYIVTAKIDEEKIKYPQWQLDYEAMRDDLFDLIFARASITPVKFGDVNISVVNGVLQVQDGKKFMRLRSFAPEHSGLIERIVEYLYNNESSFRAKYDKLLHDVIMGIGNDTTYYAVKTTECPLLLSCVKSENVLPVIQSSQISKWNQRYRK